MSKAQRLITSLLTLNTLLLAGLLWTQIAETPIMAKTASAAQQRPRLPNAGAQRQQMVVLLNEIRKSVESTKTTLESGRIKVEVVGQSSRQ